MIVALMGEAVSIFETPVNFCKTIWRNNSEDSNNNVTNFSFVLVGKIA
jgi:hypothetical protein